MGLLVLDNSSTYTPSADEPTSRLWDLGMYSTSCLVHSRACAEVRAESALDESRLAIVGLPACGGGALCCCACMLDAP